MTHEPFSGRKFPRGSGDLQTVSGTKLHADAGDGPVLTADGRLIIRFLLLSSKFWWGPTRRTASLLAAGFLVGLLANMLLAVEVNRWSKYFFDALQQRDATAIRWSMVQILALSIGTAFAAGMLIQMRMRLQVRWREWLTGVMINRWLRSERFRRLGLHHDIDNPEARIADDVHQSIELCVDLAGGVINTVLLSVTFIFILWDVGGSISIGPVTIPAYFVIAVVLFSAATSLGMYAVGWPLVGRVEEKAAAEGNFRFMLTRTREEAEAGALPSGERQARRQLSLTYRRLVGRWLTMTNRQTRMSFLSGASGVLAPVVPLVLGAPKFLSGDLTLGDLMQLSAALWQVHLALNWLADNALSLAIWSASARRVAALYIACSEKRPPATWTGSAERPNP